MVRPVAIIDLGQLLQTGILGLLCYSFFEFLHVRPGLFQQKSEKNFDSVSEIDGVHKVLQPCLLL